MNLQEAIYRCMQNNSWPDFESRKETMDTWADFTKKMKERAEQKYIFDSSVIDPHWLTESKKEMERFRKELGKITTDCKGCARLMTPNDPECKSCYKQSHYKARYTEVNIDVGFDVDIKKEMDWLAINPYIQNDIKTTVNYSKMYDERKEKDMNNGFKERAAQAVFFNKYLHRYEKIYIDKVIFNDPATIVFWNDHVKTVVKCQDGDVFDPEKGLAMAITKRFFGNQGNYCNEFQKWLPEDDGISAEELLKVNENLMTKFYNGFKMNFTLDRDRERNVQAAHKKQTCHTCKWRGIPMGDDPCRDCEHYVNWTPKEGDIK